MFALSKRAEFNLCGFNEPAPFTFSQLRLAQRESKICRRDKVAQSGDDDGCLFSSLFCLFVFLSFCCTLHNPTLAPTMDVYSVAETEKSKD